MKKLIVIALLLTSCGYQSQNNLKPNIVKETGTTTNGECYYECSGGSIGGVGEILSTERFKFYDSCGKYTVGDTVKIVKYEQ